MIARGTTPIIRVKYQTLDVSTIDVVYLTMIQGDLTIKKDLQDATVVHQGNDNYIEWALTQEETISLSASPITMQVRCRANGKAYASPVTRASVYQILKEGVI